jgi:SAM-dependent methyltransferase
LTADARKQYDQDFYDAQMSESLAAARIYLNHLWQVMQPKAVLDVGCGRGTWLKACGELGSVTLTGLDGPWNRQELMLDPAIAFEGIDLNRPFSAVKADLAISLEVAEHLEPHAAAVFVKGLTDASDAVLFGAAYPGQGGTNHINEQPQSYWAELFESRSYLPFDLFRPAFWGDERVPFWYRQNTFLYVRTKSDIYIRLVGLGHTAANRAFLDCVHPTLYHKWLSTGLSTHVRRLLWSVVRTLKARVMRPKGPVA